MFYSTAGTDAHVLRESLYIYPDSNVIAVYRDKLPNECHDATAAVPGESVGGTGGAVEFACGDSGIISRLPSFGYDFRLMNSVNTGSLSLACRRAVSVESGFT